MEHDASSQSFLPIISRKIPSLLFTYLGKVMINRLTSNIRMTTTSIKSIQSKLRNALVILQDMFRKEQMYQVIRLRQQNQSEDLLEHLEVPLDELESRARERRIYDVSEFCRSQAFQEAGYFLDETRGVISRAMAN